MKIPRSRVPKQPTPFFGRLFRSFTSLSWVILVAISAGAQGPGGSSEGQSRKSAWDIWNQLSESVLLLDDVKTEVEKSHGGSISFGGEKEASSSILTRVMGPNKSAFAGFVKELSPEARALFLREFLEGWVSGRYRNSEVFDIHGAVVKLEFAELKTIEFRNVSLEELEKNFALWLSRAGDRSFSFIKPQTRRKIFNGNFPGLEWKSSFKEHFKNVDSFGSWVPHLGDSQKYVANAHNTSVGWELNFNPQKSYGEFEKMIHWFQETLATEGNLFEAPGHQWIVYAKPTELGEAEVHKIARKMGEIYKNLQAYIYLRGIEGGSGIEIAAHKSIHADADLIQSHSTGRGVIRLEDDRFHTVDGKPAFNLEQRAGTKNTAMRQLIQKTIISRYTALEFDDLADPASWTLIPQDNSHVSDQALKKRFGLTPFELKALRKNLEQATVTVRNNARRVSIVSLVPLWQWENAPYLSKAKKEHLRKLTRSLIQTIAAMKDPSLSEVQAALQTWTAASNLSGDIEAYLRPKPQALALNQDASLFVVKPGAPVEVNQIDLGLEYTARFPLRSQNAYTNAPLLNGRRGWLRSEYDLTPEERTAVIRQTALDLGEELNGKRVPVLVSSGGDHGHSLVIQFEVKDQRGRQWKVEWDGVGRDYDSNGKIIEGSERGGHIEIVTPKFQPTHQETQAVFRTFERQNLVPSSRVGGGHINIDLATFAGKPRELARFIATFLKNRSVIALLFQHPGRLASAEPHDVSEEFVRKLEAFEGTEQELKQFLYNERFFNQRLGRKSRYVQLDLSGYFQDVIPSEHIHADFDLKNDLWRKSFNVEPQIRKMEFRLFNAPRDVFEAELQKKLVRALLNQALNESSPLGGRLQAIEYEKLGKNPQIAVQQFHQTMSMLGLSADEYRGFFLDGLTQTRQWMSLESYLPYETKMAAFPRVSGWGKAQPSRSAQQALSASERTWSGLDPDVQAIEAAELRRLTRLQLENLRQEEGASRLRPGALERRFGEVPLQKALGIQEIIGLSTPDALQVVQFQLRAGGLSKNDPEVIELLRLLKSRSDFHTSMITALKSESQDYRAWLSELLPDGKHEADTELLLKAAMDPVLLLRKSALARLQSWNAQRLIGALHVQVRSLSSAEDLQGMAELLGLLQLKMKSEASEGPAALGLSRFLSEAMVSSYLTALSPELTLLMRYLSPDVQEALTQQVLRSGPSNLIRRSVVATLAPHPSAASSILLEALMTDSDPVVQRQAKTKMAVQTAKFSSIEVGELEGLSTEAQIRSLYFQSKSPEGLLLRNDWKKALDQVRSSKDFADAVRLEYARGMTLGFQNTPYRQWLTESLLTLSELEFLGVKLLQDPDESIRKKGYVWSQKLSNPIFFSRLHSGAESGLLTGGAVKELAQEVIRRLPGAALQAQQAFIKRLFFALVSEAEDPASLGLAEKLLAKLHDARVRQALEELARAREAQKKLALPLFRARPTPEVVAFWMQWVYDYDEVLAHESKMALATVRLPESALNQELIKVMTVLLRDPDAQIKAGAIARISEYEKKISQLESAAIQRLPMADRLRSLHHKFIESGGSEEWRGAISALQDSAQAFAAITEIFSDNEAIQSKDSRVRAYHRWLVEHWMVSNPAAHSHRNALSRLRSALMMHADRELREIGYEEVLRGASFEEIMSDLDDVYFSNRERRAELLEALNKVDSRLLTTHDEWFHVLQTVMGGLGWDDEESTSSMRLTALRVFKKTPDSHVTEIVPKLLKYSRSTVLRKLLVLSLRGRRYPPAQDLLASFANDPDPIIRRLVAEGQAGACAENLRPESFPE